MPRAQSGSGQWTAQVFFGVPRDIGNDFEVTAIVVDKNGNDILNKLVVDANKNQVNIPIDLPDPIAGCPIETIAVKTAS